MVEFSHSDNERISEFLRKSPSLYEIVSFIETEAQRIVSGVKNN